MFDPYLLIKYFEISNFVTNLSNLSNKSHKLKVFKSKEREIAVKYFISCEIMSN